MAYYVQVLNDAVINVWDTPPKVPIGEDGWKNAVEQLPTIIPGRQEYGQYIFNTGADPVVISREVIEISIDDRKNRLQDNNIANFNRFVEVLKNNSQFYTSDEIATAKSTAAQNKQNINACQTHDEIDQLVLEEIPLF